MLPRPVKSFGNLHEETTADGALNKQVKELIAPVNGISARCDGCISYHVHFARLPSTAIIRLNILCCEKLNSFVKFLNNSRISS